MAKGTRITMTKAEAESPEGQRLIGMILAMCHDGELDIGEVDGLHIFLRQTTATFAAIPYLRAITRESVADGAIDEMEAYRLKCAFERVVPKEVRGVVSTHLESIGLPFRERERVPPPWTTHEATARQIEYIRDLGGHTTQRMTKGEASELIEQLLERRPPTPRQVMLLRFFDRLDLMQATKDEVSRWVDQHYEANERYERAWERFKAATGHDRSGQDPSVVPVGAYVHYMGHRDDDDDRAAAGAAVDARRNSGKAGCLGVLLLILAVGGPALIAGIMAMGR